MNQQQFSNHRMYYPLHHFIFYPIVLFGLIFSIKEVFAGHQDSGAWLIITLLWVVTTILSLMLRQHYGLGNQNRIIRMEMRFRYYILTQKRFEELEDKLSFAHIAALRFAPDDELPELVRKAINENLSPIEIKKSIKNWLADDMRV